MKTFTQRTGALALTAALILLSAQAGFCGTINPQPLPPRHLPSLIHLLAALMHLSGGHW